MTPAPSKGRPVLKLKHIITSLGISSPAGYRPLFGGILQAVTLYFLYLALSLLDPWGHVPPSVHMAAYGLLFLAMMFCILRGLNGAGPEVKRAGKILFLVILLTEGAGLWAGPDWIRRLEYAVRPPLIADYPVPDVIVTVTPPAYSGRDAFTERLMPGDESAARLSPVPEGSQMVVTVGNTPYVPTLFVGARKIDFEPAATGGFSARATLTDETVWRIQQGSHRIGAWPVVILEDELPTLSRVEFLPLPAGRGLFGLSLDLSDDYGLAAVTVAVAPGDSEVDGPLHETTLPVREIKRFDGDVYVNLAASPFAGQTVDLVLTARDHAGQESRQMLTGVTLPEKAFTAPLAARLIDIRREIRDSPDQRLKLARQLMALGLVPDDRQTPAVFYIGLRSAYWRLTKPRDSDDLDSADRLLWDLANLREDGAEARFTNDMLALLAELKLALLQGRDLAEIREHLRAIDRKIIRAQGHRLPFGKIEQLDIRALRQLYSKILTFAHHNKREQVIGLVSYLEQGFIRRDRDMLSGQGYKRFQVAHAARNKVIDLEKTQRRIISVSLKNAMKLELASARTGEALILPAGRDMKPWIASQQKVGEQMSVLERALQQSHIDASRLTTAANDLAREAADSLKAGDMEAASQYQSQILTLLKSLKSLLDEELLLAPEGGPPNL